MDTQQEILTICDRVDRVLVAVGKSRSCIDGAALLTKALHLSGYTAAYPLTVDVHAYNAAFLGWVKEHGLPQDDESADASNDAGGCTIHIGKGAAGLDDGWPGHLTVVVPNMFGKHHLMIDPTLKQADRPEFGIVLKLICCTVLDDFVRGIEPFQLGGMNGCMVVYDAYPDEHTYGNWEQIMMTPWICKAAADIASVVRSMQ